MCLLVIGWLDDFTGNFNPKQAFSKQQCSHDKFKGLGNLDSEFPTVRIQLIQVAWNFHNFAASVCRVCHHSVEKVSQTTGQKQKRNHGNLHLYNMPVCCLSSKMLQDHTDHPPKTRSECANVGLLPEILLLSVTDSWQLILSLFKNEWFLSLTKFLRVGNYQGIPESPNKLLVYLVYTSGTSIRFLEFWWLSSVWSSLTQGSSDSKIIRNRLQNGKSQRSNGSNASASESIEISEVCKGALASIKGTADVLLRGIMTNTHHHSNGIQTPGSKSCESNYCSSTLYWLSFIESIRNLGLFASCAVK